MARFTLANSLLKFGHAGAIIASTRTWNPRVFAAATPRSIQVPPSHQEGSVTAEGMKQGASETVNVGDQNLQDKAYSTTQHMSNKTKDMADQMSATAQNMTEKAKQTMQDAWDSTKNTAHRAANTVLGKAQESADCVKENAETMKKSINRKN